MKLLDRFGLPIGATGSAMGGSSLGAYPTTIIAQGATSYWRAGEAAGNYVDTIAANDLTVSGAPVRDVLPGGLTGAQDDGAVQFPLVTDFLSRVNVAALNLGDGPWSTSFLIRRDADAGAIQTIFQKGANAYACNIDPGDRVSLGKVGIAFICHSSVLLAVDGLFHHYVITRNGPGAGNTLIYADGVEGHVDAAIATVLVDNALDFTVGQEGGATPALSTFDEIALFKGILLTPAQIAAQVAAR